MNEKAIELKPCPFCGSEAELTEHGIHCTNRGNVENCCNVCNVFLVYPARGTARTQKEIEDDIRERSIKAWNKRAELSKPAVCELCGGSGIIKPEGAPRSNQQALPYLQPCPRCKPPTGQPEAGEFDKEELRKILAEENREQHPFIAIEIVQEALAYIDGLEAGNKLLTEFAEEQWLESGSHNCFTDWLEEALKEK